MSERQKSTLKKVLRYLGKYRIYLILSLVLASVTVALTLYIPKLTGRAVDFIVDKGLVDFPGVFSILIQIGVCTLVTALAQWLMNICNNKISYHVIRSER